MPLTQLDPVTALIVIDLQRGITARPAAHPVAGVVAHATQLAAAFRARALPVVIVTVGGVPPGRTEAPSPGSFPAGWDEIVPELGVQPTDHRITKRAWGAFANTGLDSHLKGHGVTQIVLAGISTSIGVESTARMARDLGFSVTLAIDAMTDSSAEAHDHSVRRIFPRLGETGSTADVLALLKASGAG